MILQFFAWTVVGLLADDGGVEALSAGIGALLFAGASSFVFGFAIGRRRKDVGEAVLAALGFGFGSVVAFAGGVALGTTSGWPNVVWFAALTFVIAMPGIFGGVLGIVTHNSTPDRA